MMSSMFAAALLAAVPPAPAAADIAARFGAREAVQDISLSPGGTKVAFVAPTKGQGSVLYTVDLTGDRTPRRAISASGDPERLGGCGWVSDARLVCAVHAISNFDSTPVRITRLIAVDADGRNLKLVSTRDSANGLGVNFSGGSVIDWLPAEDGAILVGRLYRPEYSTGTRIASTREGYGVDRIDTRTVTARVVEPAKNAAVEYISDGRGTVRIMGLSEQRSDSYSNGILTYYYRAKDSRDWRPFGTLDTFTDTGFNPYAVDPDCDCAYGFRKRDGRLALVRVKLDATRAEEVLLDRPDVDVDDLLRIGRSRRVIGASFATDRREAVYFDPVLKKLAASLGRAIPTLPLVTFVGASLDESKLLLLASADNDPGRYYVYDKATRRLDEIMLARPELEGLPLASVRSVSVRAADGTAIPAYLTLPPGGADKALPAIVMPHGGPSARDEWGFDWLSQYFAAAGYAVLQPNFRGSAGYGDAWFRDRGFVAWRTAIGDVDDAGRWLVAQGIADPARLAIVGWSYGGYAALQSGVLDPGLFKAIVAIAPVTDLASLKEARRNWSDFELVSRFVGAGAHVREGSPAQNAARFTAPVLMFSGDRDLNVPVAQARLMAARLKDAGKPGELVIFPGLDHQLPDGAARATMLARIDAFLRKETNR